jgi:hypothetical protein
MKSTVLIICIALLISCNSGTSNSESTSKDTTAASVSDAGNDAKSEEWVPVDSATAMQAMMQAGTPGKEQAILAKSDGKWKAEVTMWEKPDAAPMKSTGILTNKMILGGRYQETTFKGDMMGMPFEGVSTTGYDNARKVWIASWVDNMSTGIITMEGTMDEPSQTLTLTGKMLCPANGKMCEIKQVMKKIDDKTEIMEMYGPDMKTGKSYKNMEMKMTKS